MVTLLVGNKTDLAEEQRRVPISEVKQYSSMQGIDYIETSALDSTNVEEAFHMLIKCKFEDKCDLIKIGYPVF